MQFKALILALAATSAAAFAPASSFGARVTRSAVSVKALDEKMVEIVASQLGIDSAKVTESAAFIDDLDADSLDLVELILNLEESFGVEISDEKAQELKTVGDAQKLIDSLKK